MASALQRTSHYIDVTNTQAVELQLIPGKYVGSLKTALGIDTTAPANATNMLGTGKRLALQRGCFAINLVYERTATKIQNAKVLCSPAKADTVFGDKAGGSYGTFRIKKVTVPQRRVFIV